MNWTLVGSVVLFGVAYCMGFNHADSVRGEEIAELRKDYAERASALESSYRQKEKENAQAVVAAWEERDAALADVDRVRVDFERVRDKAARLERELSGRTGDPCASCKAELARCVGIVGRGSDLVGRSVEFSQRVAADKDALVKIVQ